MGLLDVVCRHQRTWNAAHTIILYVKAIIITKADVGHFRVWIGGISKEWILVEDEWTNYESQTQQLNLKSVLLLQIMFHTATPSCLSNLSSCSAVSRLNRREREKKNISALYVLSVILLLLLNSWCWATNESWDKRHQDDSVGLRPIKGKRKEL